MLAIGTGETITDGKRVYELASNGHFVYLNDSGKANHVVDAGLLKVIVGEPDEDVPVLYLGR